MSSEPRLETASTEEPADQEILTRIGRSRPTGFRRALRLGGIGLALLVSVAGFVSWRMRAGAKAPVRYVTAPVTRGDLAATVTATGTLKGSGTVDVGAEISGKVKALYADFNDRVKAGQLLCEIDSEQVTASLNQATAQLLSARADAKNREATGVEARLTADRTRALAAEGLSSQQQLEAAVAAAERAAAATEAAKAQITVASATLQSNRTSLAKTQIRSPIDGVVLSRNVEVGQTLIAAMSAPVLFTLAKDLKEMELTVPVDEADIGRTHVGQSASFSVDAWPGKAFPSQVRLIHNVPVTKDNVVTYEARLDVRNDELLLRPGMTATATISTDRRQNVLTVPNGALRFSPPSTEKRTLFQGPPGEQPAKVIDDGRSSLWVLRGAASVEVRVVVGLTDGQRTEVQASELKEGDLAITDIAAEKAP